MKKIVFLAMVIAAPMICFSQKFRTLSKKVTPADVLDIPVKSMQLTITESSNQVTVTAKGIESEGVRGCSKNCNVAGKISYVNTMPVKDPTSLPSPFAVGVKGVKIILTKDPTGATRISTTTDDEGYFAFPKIPAGIYTLTLHNQPIARNINIKQ